MEFREPPSLGLLLLIKLGMICGDIERFFYNIKEKISFKIRCKHWRKEVRDDLKGYRE